MHNIQSIEHWGVDDLFALRFTSIQSIQSIGGLDDLFALRFTVFRAYRVWGCR